MRLLDGKYGYGWISIALHWITALAILFIWFLGNTIRTDQPDEYRSAVGLHTSFAACAYVFLWARVIWRFHSGHPGPLAKQGLFFFLIGKYVHYCILVALAVMLVSGPLLAWSLGNGVIVFDWFVILASTSPKPSVAYYAHAAHWGGGLVILVGVLLHIAGVFKHAAINRDGTFDKMMVATAEKAPSP